MGPMLISASEARCRAVADESTVALSATVSAYGCTLAWFSPRVPSVAATKSKSWVASSNAGRPAKWANGYHKPLFVTAGRFRTSVFCPHIEGLMRSLTRGANCNEMAAFAPNDRHCAVCVCVSPGAAAGESGESPSEGEQTERITCLFYF